MNRITFVLCLLAGAAAAAGAQQLNGTDPYQGTSNPPPDQEITTTPIPKPHAGKPLVQSAPAATEQSPAAANDAVLPPAAEQMAGSADEDIVHPAPPAGQSRQPELTARPESADPDGDIVHPRTLGRNELGEGTEIRVRLIERLSTATSEKGESFSSRVASDVVRDGVVLIPAGSRIDGSVVEISSGHMGGRGAMRLRPESVVLPDGKRFQLHAQITSTPGSRTHVGSEGTVLPDSRLKRDSIEYGGAVGAGATTGAIVGGPVGALTGGLIGAGAVTAHLLIDHPQAVLEPGTVLILTLSERLNLTPAVESGS